MTADLVLPPVLLGPLLPTLIVLASGALVLLLDLLPRRPSPELIAAVALAGVVGALLATLARWASPAAPSTTWSCSITSPCSWTS